MRLAEPAWLVLLILIVLPWLGERARPRVLWPTLGGFARGPRGLAGWPRGIPPLMRALAIACLAVALARPQTVGGQTRRAARGVAIVAALDRSPSMETPDFPAGLEPRSRLEAARRTFAAFVRGRPDDLIGLIAFARYPDRLCAPTLDHAFLLETLRAVRPAGPFDSSTNLSDAIVRGLGDLRATSPNKKVLILLTDGSDNPAQSAVPSLNPAEAAGLARELGVTLHTIAIGGPGGIIRRTEPRTGLNYAVGETTGPDLELLEDLARIGGGRAFVASDAQGLDSIFRTINSLETSPVSSLVRTRYHEAYAPWVAAALALLALDRLLTRGRLRRIP